MNPGRSIFPGMGSGNEQNESYQQGHITVVERWVEENNADVAFYFRSGGLQVTKTDTVTVGRPQFVNVLLVDPQTFLPTGEIRTIDPAGVPLSELLNDSERGIVISQNLADAQGIAVGDVVRISNTTENFTVRGIVSTDLEASITNPLAAFFGFAYVHQSQAQTLQLPTMPNTISITVPPGTDIVEAERELRELVRGYYSTLPEVLERNAMIGDVLGRFIVVMGLGALLIGGVGIINTMLVMVGRRTEEIAALKTFGLKGRQVGALFLAEAFLLGVLGSIVGCIMGVILSIGVNQYGAAFLQQQLTWRIYPEALLYGVGLGVVVTLVFGILPILTANRIRPAIILRPNETHLPGVGVFHSLLALLLVVVVIGGIAGNILGNVVIGIIAVAVTLLILGVLVCLLWLVIWLVSHMPSFGSVDLRLALRNLTARRIRTATTLLALSAGMFALSSITFIGVGTREILQFQMSQNLGGNVLVFPAIGVFSQTLAQGMLNAQLAGVDGVENNMTLSMRDAELIAVNGAPPVEEELPFPVPERANRAFEVSVLEKDSSNPEAAMSSVVRGRDFTLEDNGQPVIIVSETWAQTQGVDLGSTLTFMQPDGGKDFTVIGIASDGGVGFGALFVPPGSGVGRVDVQFNVLQVAPEHLNAVLLKLSENPLVFSLDITFIDGLLKRLIDQFSAIPTVVGLLSLLAAAVAMANTVSLQTLERRRQIGVLKAVGLKGRRVLLIMLLENTLVGLLGGVIGIGVSALMVALMTSLGTGIAIPIPREATPVAVALIVAAVLIAWASTFLSARVAIRERVANVLRYE
jgi:predicted lysophospholipase L1 biosynthesis ABC-type transport system permease subunit